MPKDLTLKEQRFLELYTNPDNIETFSNRTESYWQAYGSSNRNVAGVLANRLLRKVKVKERMSELMEKSELDFSKHLNTLNTKLNKLAETGTITKEELMAIRLGLEAQGMLGNKPQTAIQINVGSDGACLENMSLADIIRLREAIDKREGELLNKFTPDMIANLPPLPIETTTQTEQL